ncbi:MAG: DNA mismatch repair protein MutS [Nitrospirae bacterium]|nr:DNA mismatch repair protein MutS [Nitrospirota bacterium]
MIQQYLQIKERHQDAIVFFRMGDFYEMFFEDAQLASKELGIALTSRAKNKDEDVPFCGVPWHSSSQYISRLLSKGHKVVVCEQTEQPTAKSGRALLRREPVRILTPGLSVEESLLESGEHRYLFAVHAETEKGKMVFGLAKLDFTTGDFKVADTGNLRDVLSEILRSKPPEVIVRKTDSTETGWIDEIRRVSRDWLAHPSNLALIELNDDPRNLDGGEPSALSPLQRSAAGLCLHYLRRHHFAIPPHIGSPEPYSLPAFLRLDDTTVRNLELTANLRDRGTRNTLWDIMNRTVSPMGKRRLMEWLLYPLIDVAVIESRYDAVDEGLRRKDERRDIRSLLSELCDFERLNARNALAQSLPREMVALRQSLDRLPEVRRQLDSWTSPLIRNLAARLDEGRDLAALLHRAVVDDPPSLAKDGGVFRAGYHAPLDELRTAVENGQKWLLELERTERVRTGIPTLKVKYHQVFGYLLEVTKSHLGRVPADYQRKQTLGGAERFKIESLVEMENRILGAEEKARALEQQLFDELRSGLAAHGHRLKAMAEILATVDALLSLAELAEERRYVRPKLADRPVLKIVSGRHPVIEKLLTKDPFIENDLALGGDQPAMLIITGPNMAGKSTFMRQTALQVIMAQMGSFVPAQEATIGIVDRVFTRIGASDDLAGGRSTFMVEMEEIAEILTQATDRSLVLVDEIGRGTSTYDGVAIAWATAEHLLDRVKARSLFATHYHELVRLGEEREGARNVHVSVKEWGNRIIFLHKVREGGTSKSYGVQVARLAGVPEEVISRAKTLLFAYEQQRSKEVQPQFDLFSGSSAPASPPDAIRTQLQRMQIEKLTPLEAFEILSRLVKQSRDSE